MSKARLVVTAVVVEGRSQSEVARQYGVSQGWVSRLVARYREEGDAAFTARSRRPRTSPNALAEPVVALIVELRQKLSAMGLDAGAHTIVWHLQHHHQLTVSPASVSRHLGKAGLVQPQPKKRPRSSYIRFEAELPNECWQSDFTHYHLVDGTGTEILTFLDDHSRVALSVDAYRRVTGPIVLNQFRKTVGTYGIPASTLTDNGMVFTTRYSGGKGGRNGLETELRRLGVVQKNSRPNHPTTCGKVERFQQTLKKWLRVQHQPATLVDLQHLLNVFCDEYNHRRPHRSLHNRSTPAAAYQARPKATPTGRHDCHYRIRRDIIDDSGVVTVRHAGRLHHIGIGRTHARTHVLLLIEDLNIRAINTTTGQLLRELVLDTTRDYQPQNKNW